MNTKIDFYINFGGFYHSKYSDLIDSIIENEIYEGYIENDSNIDYSHLHNELSKHIFDKIIEHFQDITQLDFCSTTIKYDGLQSPKYYNYSTDKIKSSVSKETFEIIKGYFNEDYEEFVDYVDGQSKSVPGFISFYGGFNEVSNEPEILLQYIFDFIQYDDTSNELDVLIYENIHEVIYNNL